MEIKSSSAMQDVSIQPAKHSKSNDQGTKQREQKTKRLNDIEKKDANFDSLVMGKKQSAVAKQLDLGIDMGTEQLLELLNHPAQNCSVERASKAFQHANNVLKKPKFER